jgi:hypothetical protein
MTSRMLGFLVLVLLLITVTSGGASLAAGYNCEHFAQTNHCHASWDSRAKACTCR